MTAVGAPYVLGAGEARWGMQRAGVEVAMLARSEDTGGRLTFMRYQAPPRFAGPALHLRQDLDEGIFVLDGHFVARLGADEHECGPGQFARMSRDVPHAFANEADTVGTLLIFISPPGEMAEFFAALDAELEGLAGPPSPEKLMALNVRYGAEVLGPPIRPQVRPDAASPAATPPVPAMPVAGEPV